MVVIIVSHNIVNPLPSNDALMRHGLHGNFYRDLTLGIILLFLMVGKGLKADCE